MSESQTSLHYASGGDFSDPQNSPANAGFNLADVSGKWGLDHLPSGVKGLVWLGMTNGVDATFVNTVSQFIGDPNVYGFYLADEPDPTQVSAANLKAESDWIHANFPGAKTFIVEEDMGSPENPDFTNNFTPANTGIDLFGIDPYPVRPQFPGGVDYSVINKGVAAAEAAGIPQGQIVPVYQAFGGGGYSSWTLPTVQQEQQILQTWGSVIPNPAFDYAYSWGSQDGDTALINSPELQQVFAAHNAGTTSGSGSGAGAGTDGGSGTDTGSGGGSSDSGSTDSGSGPPLTYSQSTMNVTDTDGNTATVSVLASGSLDFTGALNTVLHQSVVSAVDDVSSTAQINTVTLDLGPGAESLSFAGPHSVRVNGGSGADTVSVASGRNTFTAGPGTLDVTGGTGANTYVFNAGSGQLVIENYAASQGDRLRVSSSLEQPMQVGTDGQGGTLLTFGAGQSIDLVGVPSLPTIRFF
ncbi:MAG: hypothetical protein JOZ05_06225 [Acetobacteraceae bacterium]|nr:hypothetical protein [Acetobacteraceae bacterium]